MNAHKTILLIIAQEGFRDEELFETKEVLDNKGYTTIIASQKEGLCKGKLGGEAEASIAIEEIELTDDIVAVVVIGGPGSPKLMEEEALGIVLQKAREKNILLGAICYAPAVVASFGVIDGASATCYADDFSLPILKEHNILYIDELVVLDQDLNLITGNGPSAATAFGEEIVARIEETTMKEK